MYSLPFNMNTFNELWGCTTPQQAKDIIESQRFKGTPSNLEEQALSLVGSDIYNLIIKGYTQKQWQKDPKDLPEFIIKRLPLRFTYDNNYFNDTYQGIPIGGYTQIFEKLLKGIEVKLNTDYFEHIKNHTYDFIIFTGPIDSYFTHLEKLEYRSIDFDIQVIKNMNYYQPNSVVNYPSKDIPYTRIVEYKHFLNQKSNDTIIVSEKTNDIGEPYYPVPNKKNLELENLRKLCLANGALGGRILGAGAGGFFLFCTKDKNKFKSFLYKKDIKSFDIEIDDKGPIIL
jgi:UDP-galactopyranose mutase